jgi:hypothetical protein
MWQKFCCDACRNQWHNRRRASQPIVIIEELGDEKNLSKNENKA